MHWRQAFLMNPARVRKHGHNALARGLFRARDVHRLLPSVYPCEAEFAQGLRSPSRQVLHQRVCQQLHPLHGRDLVSMLLHTAIQLIQQLSKRLELGLVAVRHGLAAHQACHPAHLRMGARIPGIRQIQSGKAAWHARLFLVHPRV